MGMSEYVTFRVTSKVTKAHASGHFMSFELPEFSSWNENNSVRFQGFFSFFHFEKLKNLSKKCLLKDWKKEILGEDNLFSLKI